MVIAVQIDALRWDYIQPGDGFLSKLTAGGVSGRLSPTFGFEPDYAYFAGLYPDESNSGAQFVLNPDRSPFQSLSRLPAVLNRLPRIPEMALRRALEGVLRRKSRSPVFTSARIPFQLLHHFDLSLDAPVDESAGRSPATLFDVLRENGKSWLYHGEPRHRVDIGSAVTRLESDLLPKHDFAFVHIGDLDHAGHKFGPLSTERRSAQQRVELGLEAIARAAAKRCGSVEWLVFGDHGMADVRGTTNVAGAISALPLRLEQDYLIFIDSTMARFWFFNKRARELILDTLSRLGGGHLLSAEERNHYHLNFRDNRFGDAFFVAHCGVLISPNYYQGRGAVRGMHGYLPESPDQQSGFVVGRKGDHAPRRIEDAQDIRRIYPTFLELLGVAPPEGADNPSLLSVSDSTRAI